MLTDSKSIGVLRHASGNRFNLLGRKKAEAIAEALSERHESVEIIEVASLRDLEIFVASKPKLVFIGLGSVRSTENPASKMIGVSGFLEQHDVNHTGSLQKTLDIATNKAVAKAAIRKSGINTPSFQTVGSSEYASSRCMLQYPLFVKPLSSGGSIGIDQNSIVHNALELSVQVSNLNTRRHKTLLIEEYLPGREFSVAILDSRDGLVAFALELLPACGTSGYKMIDRVTKASRIDTPAVAVADKNLRRLVEKFAKDCFVALGCRDYGRVDVKLDVSGEPSFIELNLIPGLAKDSGYFPRACKVNAGMEFKHVINEIVDRALDRSGAFCR